MRVISGRSRRGNARQYSLVLFTRSQLSAINELCYPGGHAFARSGAQRTHKAAKNAAQVY